MIHRAIFGSLERFIALLIDIMPERFRSGWHRTGHRAADLRSTPRLCEYGARTAGGGRAPGRDRWKTEKIGFKIREAQLQKVPYMLVVGEREVAEGTWPCATALMATSAHVRRQVRELGITEIDSRVVRPSSSGSLNMTRTGQAATHQ